MKHIQSSVEFLLTYAWAFLSIAVFLAFILLFVTSGNPASYNTASCYISPGFTCVTALFSVNSLGSKFTVVFVNNIGQAVTFPLNALTVYPTYSGTSYFGNCLPANAPKGATVICNSTIASRIGSVGQQVNPKFTVNYELCSPSCAYPVVSTNTINTTGFGTLQISPQTATVIDNVTLLDSPTNGNVLINGVAYPHNAIVFFINNLGYSAYALPPNSMYTFNSWIATGGVALTSTSAQSVTATATARGTLTATFVTTTVLSTTSTTTASSTTSIQTTSTSTTTTTSTSTTSTSSTSTTSTTSTSTTSTTSSTTSSTSTTIEYSFCIGGNNGAGYIGNTYSTTLSSSGITAWISNTAISLGSAPTCAYSSGYVYCTGLYNGGFTPYSYYAPVSPSGIGTWSSTTSYPLSVYMASDCLSSNGYIYCIGGENAGGNHANIYYAPLSSSGIGTWTATTSYPVGIYATSCAVSGSYIYCVAGTYGNPAYYATISSGGIGAWTATTSYPLSVYYDSCNIYNGYIYCVNGYPMTHVTYYAAVSSSGIGAWTATTSYPLTVLTTCNIYNGYLYCVGGSTTGADAAGVSNVYYAPVSSSGIGAWTATTSYPSAIALTSCIKYT
ncbi:MAG: hypothetical protein KGH49_00890 [Candidatus Micrarchaeota archaeon]|nr:hypothetical protein [Candidatus Micrarchaeota archaeon]